MALEIKSTQIRYVNNQSKTLSTLKANLANSDPCIVFGKISTGTGLWIWDGTNLKEPNNGYNKDILAKYLYRAIDQYIDADFDANVNLEPNIDSENKCSLDVMTPVSYNDSILQSIKSML